MAAGYLRIISAGLIFTFFYNILAAALRAIGDSRTSLCVLILTTIINVVLDIIFVRNLDLGVYGAAWATVIAQAVSSLALILYIYIKVPVLRLKPSEIHINLKLLKKNSRLQLRLSPAADHALPRTAAGPSPASTPWALMR